jgi:hypothetical protein
MSKPLMQLFVLISCPADLATERQVVEAAVAETNTVLTKTHGVVLTSISWEKDLLPGIGPDAQSVINSQIEGRYDIYIGLLGARFGSETPRAGSGTEEEFNQAYKRYAAAPETVRVLFYFKNTADNVHHLDLEQLAKVIKFRKKDALNGLDSAIRLYFEERLGEPSELRAVPQQLATLIDGIRTGRVSVDQFRETIDGLPGFTVKFKKSQRTANRLLADLVAALTVFLDRAESIQRVTSEHVSSNANQKGT